MHDVGILHPPLACARAFPVVWRSIGVDLVGANGPIPVPTRRAAAMWCIFPTELAMPHAVGTDAVIPLPQEDCRLQTVDEPKRRSSGHADFRNRLRAELISSNASPPPADPAGRRARDGFKRQFRHTLLRAPARDAARRAGVYFCGAGPPPYTLNFIEAWLAGIPVVALRPGRDLWRRTMAAYANSPADRPRPRRLSGLDARNRRDLRSPSRRRSRLYRPHPRRTQPAKTAPAVPATTMSRQWNRLLKRVAAADPRRRVKVSSVACARDSGRRP